MRFLKTILIIIAALAVSGLVMLTTAYVQDKAETTQTQNALDPFYTPPNPLPNGKPGDIIRSEPLTDTGVTSGTGYRILYLTKGPNGEARASGGMVFIPTKPSKEKRPIVTYAHGTSGLGDACAPSRTANVIKFQPFIETLMDLGYVYSATDYAGLGTPGDPYYLIGASEAADVVNSVRAAQNFPNSQAGNRYAVMGHSQGGHSALWTGELSKSIAPELDLVGVSASAPAAEIQPLLEQQWNTFIGWAIGPEVMLSWPLVYPNLDPGDVLTPEGAKLYPDIAYMCLEAAGLKGYVEQKLGTNMFSKSPGDVPAWRAAIDLQTPKPLPGSMPLLINQAVGDGIVLANTNALLQQKWCKAGSNLQMNWLGQLATGPLAPEETHENTLFAAWPLETDWIQQRFAGRPPTPNCGIVPPVAPYSK